jgi:hypothetical protein
MEIKNEFQCPVCGYTNLLQFNETDGVLDYKSCEHQELAIETTVGIYNAIVMYRLSKQLKVE